MKLAKVYQYLRECGVLPKMVAFGLDLLEQDTKEVPGKANNPVIMGLAKEAGVSSIYPNDETAWCAVAQVALALRAGKEVKFTGYDRLRAKSFINFGTPVKDAMLGDTLVFSRPNGFHVGIYVGEDATAYHVLGGNQSNMYCIIRIEKSRCIAIRRPEYKTAQPASVKRYLVGSVGELSRNEA